MKLFRSLLLLCASVASYNDTSEDFRKHYGLSAYSPCKTYEKVFKCLTACKSIGFQIFRLNRACKCTCHEMKTTTILPFFMWRTNGTTRKIPQTRSVSLYHVVGTLSPATEVTTEVTETENSTDTTVAGNTTATTGNGTTEVTQTDNSTDSSTQASGNSTVNETTTEEVETTTE